MYLQIIATLRFLTSRTSVLLVGCIRTYITLLLYLACCLQIDDYSLVQFLPLDISDEDSLTDVLLYIDSTVQYGEDSDVKVPKVCGK